MVKLTEEEKKLPGYFEHRLECRRVWLEKGLLALLFGVAILLGNLIYEDFKTDLTLAVEDFKADLTVSKFLLEERLKGIKAIRAAYNQCSACMESCLIPDLDPNDTQNANLYEEYHSKVLDFNKVVNQWSVLYPDNFSKALVGHSYLHYAIAHKKIVLTKEHDDFIESILIHFDNVTRKALYNSTLGKKEKVGTDIFEFDKDSLDRISNLSTKEFFDINFEKHKKEKSQIK